MKKLKIDLLVNDGSPIGVVHKDIYGDNGRVGVGGAELALLTLCEAWNEVGHEVRLYNSPSTPNASPFKQYPIDTFIPREPRDILIIFRSPNHRIEHATGKKIWFSTDQYTVGSFKKFAKQVDEIVTISPFHAEHFKSAYGIYNTHVIDLPVRLGDYEQDVEKIKHRMIFCSVPDRGLNILAQAYPHIKQEVPDASLVITSDYRLWGSGAPMNEQFIKRFINMEGVQFLGAVPRREMVIEQMKAEVQAYPSTYDELFCYAVAECSVAGAYPITSTTGAIATTNMGTLVGGNPLDPRWASAYAEEVIKVLRLPELPEMRSKVSLMAKERFSLERIMKQWDEIFYD